MAKGKYVEWLTDDSLALLRAWAREGYTDEQIARKIGITRKTLYDWENKFPVIRENLKKGKEYTDVKVEEALVKRCLGYDVEEVTTEIYKDGKKHIRKVNRHIPGDVTAIIFWLKNRRPDRWRDRPFVEEERVEVENSGLTEAINNAGKSLFEDGDDSSMIQAGDDE